MPTRRDHYGQPAQLQVPLQASAGFDPPALQAAVQHHAVF